MSSSSNNLRNRFSLGFLSGKSNSSPRSSSQPSTNGKAKQEQLVAPPKLSRSDREAYACAISIRSLTVPSFQVSGSPNNKVSRSAVLSKIQGQLLDPTSGIVVINHLRRLPRPSDTTIPTIETIHTSSICAPNKLVALSVTDEEASKLFSSRLRLSPKSRLAADGQQHATVSIHNASLSSIMDVLKDLQVVSFLGAGTLGIGDSVENQPSAILSGSLPSAETLLAGFTEITKALLDVGYATDELPYPDHTNVHPPTDRTSIVTFWWGFELCLPHPSVDYLGRVDSVATTLIHLLSVISILDPDLKGVMPIITYATNIIGSEWDLVKSQDKGKGVVCTGTWIMPIALVPRPWDFPSAPAPHETSKPTEGSLTTEASKAPTTVQ